MLRISWMRLKRIILNAVNSDKSMSTFFVHRHLNGQTKATPPGLSRENTMLFPRDEIRLRTIQLYRDQV